MDTFDYATKILFFCFPEDTDINDEVILNYRCVLGKALICDDLECLKNVFELTELGENLEEAVDQVEGAGWLGKPTLVKITAIGIFELEKYCYLATRYDFINSTFPPQYSIAALQKLKRA